jgi:lipopolysaccharide/colanic/teichoic acid biosynthesis glycosyltransferase
MHVVWPWCETLTVRFWLGLWLFLNVAAPLLGLLVRRLIRQRALFVTDTHTDRVGLLRWWGFQCDEVIGPAELGDWLHRHADETGRIEEYDLVVVDTSDYRVEYAATGLARDYFIDLVGVPSLTMTAYLVGPHPKYISTYSLNGVNRRMKRLLDLVCVGLAIAILAPLFIGVALLIKLDSKGPVFYRHRRLGRNMKEFWLLKFRTMHQDADKRLKRILENDPKLRAEFEATYKLRNDPRVTNVGRVLRKLSVDELPQFFNVIAGQMSMVGPRPIVRDEVKYYKDYSLLLFRVLPGATGLWQVSGRSETGYEQRVELDTRYVQNWTLLQDLGIIFRTIPAVLKRRGAY